MINLNWESLDFFNQLKEAYSDKIIRGKKTSQEILEVCHEKYGISRVSRLTELDYMSQIKLEEFIHFINMEHRPYVCDIYVLKRNERTEQYYEYYRAHFGSGLKVYIYHENKTDKLYSNCDLLNIMLKVIGGIDEEEIAKDEGEYFAYLNYCYECDCKDVLLNAL